MAVLKNSLCFPVLLNELNLCEKKNEGLGHELFRVGGFGFRWFDSSFWHNS